MLLGVAAGFMAGLLGWQVNLISIHRGISFGRRAGFLVGLGAVAGESIWILCAFAGAQTLFSTHSEYLLHFRWLGVFTITVAALRILFHRSRKKASEPRVSSWAQTKNMLIGFLVVIGNPLLLVLWMGVSSFILTYEPSGLTARMVHFLFLSGFMTGGAVWCLILFVLIFPRVRQWTDERFHMISRCFAALLLMGAGMLAYKFLLPSV